MPLVEIGALAAVELMQSTSMSGASPHILRVCFGSTSIVADARFKNARDNSLATPNQADESDPGAKASLVEGSLCAVVAACECMVQQAANQAYQSVTPVKTGANAWLHEAVANRSDVMVSIFVDGVCWCCTGFDNCTEERSCSAAEIQALRGSGRFSSGATLRIGRQAQGCGAPARRRSAAATFHGTSS